MAEMKCRETLVIGKDVVKCGRVGHHMGLHFRQLRFVLKDVKDRPVAIVVLRWNRDWPLRYKTKKKHDGIAAVTT